MLYNLLVPYADDFQLFNLFRYLTFRTGAAIMTSLIISFVIGPHVIRWLKYTQSEGQPIRDDGPESHLITKKGTPTMGGLMMLFSVFVSTLLWADVTNDYVWIVLCVTMGYGLIGFTDDYLKVSQKNTKGLPGKFKLLIQISIAILATLWIQHIAPDRMDTHLTVSFF